MKYYSEGDLGKWLLEESNVLEIFKKINYLFGILKIFWKYDGEEISLKYNQPIPNLDKMYRNRVIERISNLPDSYKNAPVLIINNKEYKPIMNISSLVDSIEDLILSNKNYPVASISHGDFFFSNILKHENSVKIIDPRGNFGNGDSVLGDKYYDLAKLRHSISGYDFIINEKFLINHHCSTGGEISVDYNVNFNSNNTVVTTYFDTLVKELGLNPDIIELIEGLLFLTMIPLHTENKSHQDIFYAMALEKLEKFRK